MRASTTVRAGHAKRWFRHTRSTKAGVLGVGTPVIIAARHRDPRPRDFEKEERVKPPAGGTFGYKGPGREKPMKEICRDASLEGGSAGMK